MTPAAFSLWLYLGYKITEVCTCVYALPHMYLLTCVYILRDLMWLHLFSSKLIYIAMIMSLPSCHVPQYSTVILRLYLFIEGKINRLLEYILKIDKINLKSTYPSAFYWCRVVLKTSRPVKVLIFPGFPFYLFKSCS